MMSKICQVILTLLLLAVVAAEDIAIDAWMVLSTTYSNYNGNSALCDDAVKAALATEMGMEVSDITTYSVTDESGSAKVSWVASVTTTQFSFNDVETALVEGQTDGTLANAIQIAASLNSATPLSDVTVSSISVVSTEPTQAPTPAPTAAPTALTLSTSTGCLRSTTFLFPFWEVYLVSSFCTGVCVEEYISCNGTMICLNGMKGNSE